MATKKSKVGITHHAHKTSAIHHAAATKALAGSVRRSERRADRRGSGDRATQAARSLRKQQKQK